MQPTKHVLLQKETLVTHDKTWLPARLQPPRQTDGVPYGVYLAAYEQYLHALRYMKGRFLEGRRFDLSKRPQISPVLQAPVSYAVTGSLPMVSRPLVFGTANLPANVVGMRLASEPPTPVQVPGEPGKYTLRKPLSDFEYARIQSFPIPPSDPMPYKHTVTEKQAADRKAAKKARRKARAAANKVTKDVVRTQALTEKVDAQTELIRAQVKLTSAKKKAKRSRPSAVRRKAKRAAKRAAAADGAPGS
jgi:hypothetical protein